MRVMIHPFRPRRALVALALLLTAAVPASAQEEEDAVGTLGTIAPDYEVHGELVLVSGQLQGFAETCGFGRKPDRDELLQWYDHHRLARSMARMEGIYELGVELGREGPCTAEQNRALVRHWEALMNRTRAFVAEYR